MENDNLSFIFYKKYESFDEKYFLNFNYTNNNKDLDNNLYNYWLEMETDYPGLLIGSGYNTNNSDIKLSFDFDYLTGDPIIRGSSIKGILRELFDKIKVQPTESNDTISENISNYLINNLNLPLEILNSITSKEEFLIYLKYYIFEGKIFNETTSEFDYIPIKKRYKFFDSYISDFKVKKIFEYDYITKHESIFKDPIPIKFLKIKKGISFKFYFFVEDIHFKDYTIKKENIVKLFQTIIETFGIGAKRNYDYGSFIFKTDLFNEKKTFKEKLSSTPDKSIKDYNNPLVVNFISNSYFYEDNELYELLMSKISKKNKKKKIPTEVYNLISKKKYIEK